MGEFYKKRGGGGRYYVNLFLTIGTCVDGIYYTVMLTCTVICCTLRLGFSHPICMASLIFNANALLAVSIISKHVFLQRDLQLCDCSKCLKICDDLLVRCSSKPYIQMSGGFTNIPGITTRANKAINNKGFHNIYQFIFCRKYTTYFK